MEAHTRIWAVSQGPWGGRYVGKRVHTPSLGLRSSVYGSGLLDAVKPSEDVAVRCHVVSEVGSRPSLGPHVALWPAQRAFRGQLVEYLLGEIHHRLVEILSLYFKLCRYTVGAFDGSIQDQTCVCQEPWHNGVAFWNTSLDPGFEAQLEGPEESSHKHDTYLN